MPAAAHLRLAPTPSGLLHVGNGVNAVLTARWAAELRGDLLLRVDDIDAERVRPAYVADVFATLAWLGIDYDRGPRTPADLAENWSQHRRMATYRDALARLRENGRVYACTCSRAAVRREQARLGVTGYPGTCRGRGLPLDTPGASWRLRTPEDAAAAPGSLDDFVVRQRDGRPAYQVASLVDDVTFGITHLVRGEDLRASTAMQRVLAQALSEEPGDGYARFRDVPCWHHPLLRGANGEKLSKSDGAESLWAWREAGRSPDEVYTLAEQFVTLS